MPLIKSLILLLLTATCLHAAEPDLLSFADSLASEGDHYRAITEYKRFIHYHPDDPRGAYAHLQIARSLIAGERWAEADDALKRVWTESPGSQAAQQARKLYADSAYRRGDIDAAQQRYQEQQSQYNIRQLGMTALLNNQPDVARQHFSALEEPLRSELDLSVDGYLNLAHKSPELAGTLSAVLPGSGQLYSGRPRQAAIAFALNAAFIYAAVEAWDNDNYATSAILSLFEMGWYGGNIYNAMNNAHKFNKRQRLNFIDNLEQHFELSLGLMDKAPAISAQFRF